MKTTIDIPNSLFEEAKRLAARKGKTFREVVDTALRFFLKNQKMSAEPFKLKKRPFRGKGLSSGLTEGNWSAIRERAYEGHGG